MTPAPAAHSTAPRPAPAASGATAAGPVLIARIGARADLSQEAAMPRGAERKAAVYADLVETARTSQVEALARVEALRAAGDVTAVESMFLPNALLVTATPGREAAVTAALRGVASITDVAPNRTFAVQGRLDAGATGAAGAAAGAALLAYAQGFADGPRIPGRPVPGIVAGAPRPEWGVATVRAPEAWARGIDGRGVTIGIVDTGLDAQHPAIRGHYRGTGADGSQQHDHNWFDPFTRSTAPFDDGEHGTHVAGTAAGGSPDRAIGVAPGASIIAAKAIGGSGYNTSAATLSALQWMLAPTRVDGTGADPRRGADVVNNSWGNADGSDRSFEESFAALTAAGIEVVSAAGNDGPGPGTVGPPGSYAGYMSVAATTDRDTVAAFSSRGPSRFARPEELVPNLAAPGSRIVSAVPGGDLRSMSGTSMAAPHVAGAVALLLQARPQATHAQLVAALERSAVDIDRRGPDTAAGHGRIDVVEALAELDRALATPASA